MTFKQQLLGAMALAAIAHGHPAKEKRAPALPEHEGWDQELTVFDVKVAAPTHMPGEVVYFKSDGSPALTTTEMVMVMPTPGPEGDEDCKTTTTMTTVSTETYTISLQGAAQPSPAVAAGGRPSKALPVKGGGPLPHSSTEIASSDSGKNKDTQPSGDLFGISYAPYRADHSCKTAEDIMDDFERLAGDYSLVRIYGTDCDQVPPIYKAAKKIGVKLMMGIWDINKVQGEAQMIAKGIEGDWDIVHSVGVGNELVNNQEATADQVVQAVSLARSALRGAGFQGPVAAVDTFIATEAHPELCDASDLCAINAHPFFDSTMEAGDAGKWLQNTAKDVQAVLSKPKQILITEAGWPTDGAVNGKAVPGLENQKIAIAAIKEAFADKPGDVILFSAFDDLWKEKTMVSFNADQHWGIGGAISNCDLALI
ncbi:Glycoside hydrolase [Emericellopsis cladophorae]|uniref:Glycoside hydrolase n=1 Tax=Emericellopsis cladophorae TaxID=2686198 RepID=A0A9Q0BBL8_9HYPO|nr:Glycoside hydrolase [Emericellopsis cladophorae]KAI6779452.1 Glycoside hydrolase [Emericellopsis cladophorae]